MKQDMSNLTISRFIRGNERRRFKDIIKFLAMVIDLAAGHRLQNNYRVALSGVQFAAELDLSLESMRNIFYGGLLHDIGEVALPTDLQEKFSQYTQEIKGNSHTIIGSRIVSLIPTLDGVTRIIRWHHEAWNGTGYPDKLKGDEIPIEASIISLFDSFYFIRSKEGDEKFAWEYLKSISGKKFSPELINSLFKMASQTELWSPENFDEQAWTALGFDIYELAKLQDVDKNYVEIALNVIAQVIDAKHRYTHGHSRRVMILSSLIAEKMNLDRNMKTMIEQGALLHDSGKVSIPREILDKTTKLTDEEYNIIKSHPVTSYALIQNFTTLQDVAPIARYHHERYDGNGYPDGISHEEIPLGARVVAVADTYDAITSSRAYRNALSDKYARHEIRRYAGKMFDPEVVEAFLEIPEYQIKLSFDLVNTTQSITMA